MLDHKNYNHKTCSVGDIINHDSLLIIYK